MSTHTLKLNRLPKRQFHAVRTCKHFAKFGHRSELSIHEPCKEKFRPNRIDQVFCSKYCSASWRDKKKRKIALEERKISRAVVAVIKALKLDPEHKDAWLDIAFANGFDCFLKRIVEAHCKLSLIHI